LDLLEQDLDFELKISDLSILDLPSRVSAYYCFVDCCWQHGI